MCVGLTPSNDVWCGAENKKTSYRPPGQRRRHKPPWAGHKPILAPALAGITMKVGGLKGFPPQFFRVLKKRAASAETRTTRKISRRFTLPRVLIQPRISGPSSTGLGSHLDLSRRYIDHARRLKF